MHWCACAAAEPISARLSPTAPTRLGVSTHSARLDASNSWCSAWNVGRCGAGAPLPPAPPPVEPCIATHSLRASFHEHSPRHSVAPDSGAPVTHAAHVAARWCPHSTHAPGSCGSDSNTCSLASNSSSRAALRLKESESPWRLRPCFVLACACQGLRPPRLWPPPLLRPRGLWCLGSRSERTASVGSSSVATGLLYRPNQYAASRSRSAAVAERQDFMASRVAPGAAGAEPADSGSQE